MRFDYDDYDGEDWPLVYGRWEAALKSTLNGRPGLAGLRKLEAALVALPSKRLIRSAIVQDGEVCALGALALQEFGEHGSADPLADLSQNYGYLVDEGPSETEETSVEIGQRHGMSRTLAVHIAQTNDEGFETDPTQRYERMLATVRQWIAESKASAPAARPS